MATKQEDAKADSTKVQTIAEKFQKLITEHVENCNDSAMKASNFKKYSLEIQKAISVLIFNTEPSNKELISKTLKIYRNEACFHNPYDYNDWIKEIKKQIVEKEKNDIWEEVIVKNQLGLLWAKDCEFFDDMEDDEPAQFYKLKTESSANEKETKRLKLTEEAKADSKKSEVKKDDKILTADQYLKLVKEKVMDIDPDDDEKKIPIFDELSRQFRETLTDLILKSTNFDYRRISYEIKKYREQACFYNPYDYNDWIEEIKSMVKERNLFGFWKNVIVEDGLGLLWAEDCDFFDDMEDDKPEKFYKIDSVPDSKKSELKEVGVLTPARDYKLLVEREVEDIDPEREDEKMDIFDNLSKQIQVIIENLLFKEAKLDSDKVAETLKTYRDEACFYNPYDYNDWIKEIKSKIVEKKMFDFWKNVVVKKKLGLLWAADCDFFDDMDDEEPEKFYEIEN